MCQEFSAEKCAVHRECQLAAAMPEECAKISTRKACDVAYKSRAVNMVTMSANNWEDLACLFSVVHTGDCELWPPWPLMLPLAPTAPTIRVATQPVGMYTWLTPTTSWQQWWGSTKRATWQSTCWHMHAGTRQAWLSKQPPLSLTCSSQ